VAQGAAVQGDVLSGGTMQLAGAGGEGILLLDVTPLSLSIETVGGVATRLVERNSTLPIHYSQVFSTAAPYQRSVEIHVLQGERPMARDNKTIGKFKLNGIKKAPAGVPQIEVTFDIDANGILKVSARDLDTGKEQSITISANDKMSEDEIQQAIRDAEQYAAEDATRRSALTISNEAFQLISRVEQAMNKLGKELDKEEKKRLKEDIAALRKLVTRGKPEKMTEDDLSAIQSAMEQLERSGADVVRRAGDMGGGEGE
jgi:molecular chaperone DnaK